jgi:hypothetical protein
MMCAPLEKIGIGLSGLRLATVKTRADRIKMIATGKKMGRSGIGAGTPL